MAQQESQAVTSGYGIREVAEILDLPARRVRARVRASWIEPSRGPRGAQRLSFPDVALLRRIRDLEASRGKAASSSLRIRTGLASLTRTRWPPILRMPMRT